METRANHVWVGAVTLALFGALALAWVWLAHLGEGRKNDFDIFFRQSVDGLSKGSAVSYAGVPAGQIQAIELWKKDPGFVRVRVSVDPKIPILQGTTATIQGSFTGVSTIMLNGGVKGAPAIAEAGPEGVPVIPTKRGGLGELLSNAPLLLERLATLTERLTLLLSDDNQKSISNILAHTDKITKDMADASPQLKKVVGDLDVTLLQAQKTLAGFEKVAGSADKVLGENGDTLAKQLRETLSAAKGAADSLKAAADGVKPAGQQLSQSTLPAAEAAIRDLRATSKALRDITEKIDSQGAGSLLGGTKVPEYKP
jgi:phospholipid/cholesterol/gamma-HCH transport system substrate-binding protein